MEKELAFGETRIKKLKTSNFLKVLHFFDAVLELGIYLYTFLHKQSCQQNSHLDIVTISQQYRAASWQWLLSNNIIQDLALACPIYRYLFIREILPRIIIHNHHSDRCSTNGMKIWSLLSDLNQSTGALGKIRTSDQIKNGQKNGWLTECQGQNLNTVPTQVFIWQKVLFMLDLNCLRSNELCLHTLVKWLCKLTQGTLNVYMLQNTEIWLWKALQHLSLPDSLTSWKIIEQYWLNFIVLNKGWILY